MQNQPNRYMLYYVEQKSWIHFFVLTYILSTLCKQTKHHLIKWLFHNSKLCSVICCIKQVKYYLLILVHVCIIILVLFIFNKIVMVSSIGNIVLETNHALMLWSIKCHKTWLLYQRCVFIQVAVYNILCEISLNNPSERLSLKVNEV